MAANSKREQIIQNIVDILENVSAINTVARLKLGFDEMKKISSQQFPYVAVFGGLPVPLPKPHGRRTATRDVFISALPVSIIVYGQDRNTPDQSISSVCDDIWAALWTDPTRGGLAIAQAVLPESESEIFDPYYAFRIELNISYTHRASGI